LSYGYNNNKTYPGTAVSMYSHSIGVNVFSQRFFTLPQNLFFTINTGASAAFSFGKQTNTSVNFISRRKSTGYGISVSLAPGLSYRLTQRLLFDAYLSNLINISYFHTETNFKNTQTPDTKSTQNNFNLSSSLSNTTLGNVGLGFRWLLKTK